MKKLFLTILMILILMAGNVNARRNSQVSKKIDAEGAEKIIIQAELGAGEFLVISRNIDEVALIEIEYNARKIDYEIDYQVKRSTGYLTLESDHDNSINMDSEDNRWDITLSKKYETEISFEIGACEAEMDLGGIPISSFELEVGAASGVIEFSEPNPIRLKEFSIEAGACSLELISLGNANFDEFNFSGGVGSFEIDLRGKYDGESRVEIEIGLGSAEIYIPMNIPVRIETQGSNWLSSIDFHNDDLDEIDEDLYESPDFEDADDRIVIIVEVGLGSIDFYWKK